MISLSAVYSSVFPKGSITGCDHRVGYDSSLVGVWIIFFLDCSSPFCFLLIEFHSGFFPISYIVLIYYYYCILLGFNTLFSHFFTEFLLFSPNGSVTGCDSSLGSFCYSPVYFLSRMHLHSGYVVIGVLRSLWFTDFSFEYAYCCLRG